MVGDYYNSIYGNYDDGLFRKDFAICTTGHCTWKPFPTLSLCSQCKNITSFLVPSKFDERATMPQLTIPGEIKPIMTPRLRVQVRRTAYSDRVHSSFATGMLFAFATERGGPPGGQAFECAMSFCIQVIEASVENNRLKEVVLETYEFDNRTIKEMSRNITISPPPKEKNSTFVDPISLDLYDPVWIDKAFTLSGSALQSDRASTDIEAVLAQGVGNISSIMDTLAIAMGRSYRVACSGSTLVPGVAYVPVLMVRVRWYWLALPFAVELLGLVFFLVIVALNRNSGASLWKTSFLAVAFHGVKLENTSGPQINLEKISQMEAVAGVRVKLQDDPTDGGARSRLRY